ncbi:hypothetical protein C0J52_08911 [Blattella germanica]|nr:hypothetical protein C0J52_08911 [Blattella germanica]
MVLCWPLVLLVFRERLVQAFPWISLLVSCIVVVMLLVMDLGLPLYHTSHNHSATLRPAYTTHTLIVCYVFLPLTENVQAFILSLVVSLCHLLALGTATYHKEDNIVRRLASDCVYLICVNGLGLYFRLMNEVSIRRTFLDRRACLESNSKVEYEKQQEENLIDMYVTKHDNVTILYADVVKYAQLTVSLPVKMLVETLNELFGRFDEASKEHGVLRIKFLGDCYYCVSGVPEYNPNHAKNCVSLGLDMIAIIKEVREERKLKETLDMRIGIHSGKILSGLLGVCKWQYDVWSRDVIIASNMEQAGRPGRVHITKETLDLLGNKYRYIPGNGSSRNEVLQKYNIETFFIIPIEKVRKSGNDNLAVGSRRRMVFMDDNLYKYQQTLKKADEQMAEAIKKMQVGIYDRWLLREKINPLCLTFENIKWEVPFLKQPDPLFKFYVGCCLLVLLGMLTIQCLGLPSSHWSPWVGYGVSIAVLLILLPLTWTHYIWNKFKDPHEEQDSIPEPRNKILKLLYRASLRVVWSAATRTILYLIMTLSLIVCALLELIECHYDAYNSDLFLNSHHELPVSEDTFSAEVDYRHLLHSYLLLWSMVLFSRNFPGLSHGSVTAGVIGAQKPHYDIWGHSVNMASRMESTGEPGRIQVTENTAKVLQQYGVKCEYRGDIKVKSMTNLVTTYYVEFDENFHLRQSDDVLNSEQNDDLKESEGRDFEERYIEEYEDNTRL